MLYLIDLRIYVQNKCKLEKWNNKYQSRKIPANILVFILFLLYQQTLFYYIYICYKKSVEENYFTLKDNEYSKLLDGLRKKKIN